MEDLITTRDCQVEEKIRFTAALVDGIDTPVPVVTCGGLMIHTPVVRDTEIELRFPQFAVTHMESGRCLGYVAADLNTVTAVAKTLVEKFKITPDDPVERLMKTVSFKHDVKRMRTFGSLKRHVIPDYDEDDEDAVPPDTSALSVQRGWDY